jgi:nicotinamide-nucleotide amidase
MAEAYLRPLLEETLPREIEGERVSTVRQIVRIVGVGESQVDEWLAALMSDANPSLRPYAKEGEVHLRLVARAGTIAEATELVAGVVVKIRSILGSAVYGLGDGEDLERVTLDALKERSERVALAESLTGGLVLSRLASVPGASQALSGGIVAYRDEVKIRELGVSADVLAVHGPVSRQTAEAMASGVRQRFGIDWGVSLTGWAGPDAPPGQTVGDVWFGIAGQKGVHAVRRHFGLPRNVVRQRAVTVALDLLRRSVLGFPVPETADPAEAVKG